MKVQCGPTKFYNGKELIGVDNNIYIYEVEVKCSFCGKDLDYENFIGNIRRRKKNKLLPRLCKDCYDKLTKPQHNETILQSDEDIV